MVISEGGEGSQAQGWERAWGADRRGQEMLGREDQHSAVD